MKNSFWNTFLYYCVPPLALGLVRLLFGSCRIREIESQNRKDCEDGGPYIAAFWHYALFLIIHLGTGISRRNREASWVAMVSASQDGEYVSRVMKRMGYGTVRGSRGQGKGGLTALRELIKWVEKGSNIALVADGSQGPEFVVQAGVILLASRTGAPVLPVAWSADRYWQFRSWDRSILPKPFARIMIHYGKPLVVPAGLKAQDLESFRLDLERQLNVLYQEVWGKVGRRGH